MNNYSEEFKKLRQELGKIVSELHTSRRNLEKQTELNNKRNEITQKMKTLGVKEKMEEKEMRL